MNKPFYAVADGMTPPTEINKLQPGETITNPFKRTLGALAINTSNQAYAADDGQKRFRPLSDHQIGSIRNLSTPG